MQVNAASLSADGAPAEGAAARLISIPFLLLRVSTAGGAFAMGLVQTLVFARVLTPDRFSLFILVGAIGYSLWLCADRHDSLWIPRVMVGNLEQVRRDAPLGLADVRGPLSWNRVK